MCSCISPMASRIVIRRLSNIICFSASMFSSVVDVLGRPRWASSLTSSLIPELNCSAYSRLANTTVIISNVLTHFISFFTQILIQVLWSILYRIVKNRRAQNRVTNLFISQKQTNKPKWFILSTYITDMCTNITVKIRKLNIRNSQNLKITDVRICRCLECIKKISLRRPSLSRCLTKTLRVNNKLP